eukprot:g9406.t3
MESSRAFWWVKVKGSGSSIMIYEEELAKTKNAYNILEIAKTKTCLEVPIHMLKLFEREKDSHEGQAVRNSLSVHHVRGGNDDLDPLYVSYPDECPDASSSAQVSLSDIIKMQEKIEQKIEEENAKAQEKVTQKIEEENAKAQEKVMQTLAVPLGFLTSVPGVSTLAGNSYVLNAVEYAKKENPMTALWTAGPVVFSAVVGAARSTYNYFFPPQDASTLQLTRDGLAAGMGDCWPVAQVLLCLAVQPLLLDGLDNPHQQPAAGLALAASRQHLAAGLVEGVVSQLLLAGSVAQPLRAARRPVQRPVAFLGDYLEAGQAG